MPTPLVDLGLGALAGMSVRLVDYPLDTVKVRIQSAERRQSMRQTMGRMGFRDYYRGIPMPLTASMLECASLFGCFSLGKQWILGDSQRALTIKEISLCGAFSGFLTAVVLTPCELIKIRLQLYPSLNGVVDCVRHVYRHDGVTGFFRGLSPTLIREIPGNAVWFSTFYGARQFLAPEGDPTIAQVALSGGLAGVTFALPYCPADRIKTCLQNGGSMSKWSPGAVIQQVYQTEGIRGFYRGLGVLLLKCVPANAVIFIVYENLRMMYQSRFEMKRSGS